MKRPLKVGNYCKTVHYVALVLEIDPRDGTFRGEIVKSHDGMLIGYKGWFSSKKWQFTHYIDDAGMRAFR